MATSPPLKPRTLAIGLMLSPAGLPGGQPPGLEVAQPDYRRMTMDFAPAADDDRFLANVATVEWPRALSLWGDIGWLAAWTTDGVYTGWGTVIAQVGLTTQAIIRIDRGDVARFRAGAIFLGHATFPGSPYGRGRYGSGPYSASMDVLIAGEMRDTFMPAGACAPSNWIMEGLP
jgi:hypothetical protein